MKDLSKQVQTDDKAFKKSGAHASQVDAAKGFGGKYGVQEDRVDKVSIKKFKKILVEYLVNFYSSHCGVSFLQLCLC